MSKIKLPLRARSPALANAVRIARGIEQMFESKTNKRKVSDNLMLITNFCALDILMDMALTYNSSDDVSLACSHYMEDLQRLKLLSDRYKELQEPLKNYLLRLKEFSERNDQLKPVYEAYQQAFGGTA